ncbi:site-specific recombinase [Curvibacter sp. CHRR-16]|uniref:site-specific recombinase n=1 Tax=Curvibacter sp. CHRR-16 TaxID=2835872 RepID=UPI001BDA3C2E|nr:recombinase [Curvibacter sp. CHRR-16]MBT0568999.1 site-specific recombinase [Curvibacter sp. CHRR-16]
MALHNVLQHIAAQPQSSDTAALVDLVNCLRPARVGDVADATERMQTLIAVLRGQPKLAQALASYLGGLLVARDHSFLLAESGILSNTGFFSELWHRVGNRLLPPALDERFLRDLLDELFPHKHDAPWLQSLPATLWQDLLLVLQDQPGTPAAQRHVQFEMGEALRILACRLAAVGLEPEMVRYYPQLVEYDSPFLAQQRELETVLHRWQTSLSEPSQPMLDAAHAEVLLAQCTEVLARIRKLSHEAGAAVRLSWLLTRAEQMIERMQTMLQLLRGQSGGIGFFVSLVRYESQRGSVRELFSSVTDLLSLQITEHASKTGEHYVASSRAEFLTMFRAAAGAGVFVAFMAIIKMYIGSLHLAPAWEALGYSLNYGLGFVFIHLCGFTIATKQPAMTAATLAAALDPRKLAQGRYEALAETIAQVSRTQFIAIVGNVLVALLVSTSVAMVWTAYKGASFVSADKAAHLLHDLHPWHSLAIVHAAIAGCFLFMAGLISGYYDNKAIYNRVPDRLRRVRWLRRLLGARRLDAVARYVEHNLGALAGNFAFGFMLGCMGTIGFIVGMPLDIRHITFGAANLAYASQALGFAVYWGDALVYCLGVFLIGLTNLGVSFSLALRVALKSRRIRVHDRGALLRAVWQRFKQRPRDFVWPPQEAQNTPPSSSHSH